MSFDSEQRDFAEIAAVLAAMSGSVSLSDVAERAPGLVKSLRNVHPLKTAATFGALLTQRRLQPNCLRLEVLVHLSVAFGQGSGSPTSQILLQGYSAAGNLYGHMEDPPEDIFVGQIHSKRGNYRILEGIWESATFYLQRFVNIADAYSENPPLRQITDCIHALLTLSELVCRRANLQENELGDTVGANALPQQLARRSAELRKLVSFSFDELANAGINRENLQPFLFDPAARKDLLTKAISNSDLEAHPLATDGDQVYLLLPTAVSVAIRRYLIGLLGTGDNRRIFLRDLGAEYSRTFSRMPVLGDGRINITFTHRSWGSVSFIHKEVDTGRHLVLIFFMDTLAEFYEEGFGGMYSGNEDLERNIGTAISETQKQLSCRDDFKDGIVLIVGCGVGRGAVLPLEEHPAEKWNYEFLSAADYCTLSKADRMTPMNLWRILQMKERLEEMGVVLQNMNGFLNLYAWSESLDGHLVPHADIPDSMMDEDQRLHIGITQNGLSALRQTVAKTRNVHAQRFVDGTWREVITEGKSAFAEDDESPLYVAPPGEDIGPPIGAHLSKKRCWWYELKSPEHGPATTSYDRWRTMDVWLQRSVPPLERAFGKRLGDGPVLWRCIYLTPRTSTIDIPDEVECHPEVSQSIAISTNTEERTVTLTIDSRFDQALRDVENVAERALVAGFVRGVASLADAEEEDIDQIVREIVPNAQARHSHVFYVQGFRDGIQRLQVVEPITISRFDDAASKLGMGWRVRKKEEGGLISGRTECMAFLNSLVRNLEDDLCQKLKLFNRKSLLSSLLLNHEVGSASRERWHRTASAVLGLRKDKAAALGVMRDHDFKLNAAFQGGRNLMEMVLCESPLEGGSDPGDLDISRLLASAAVLFHYGGWSDLIFWEMMEAKIIVRPLGDVHANLDFLEKVLDNFGNASSEYRYMHSVKSYGKNLKEPSATPEIRSELDTQFVKAWDEDFGVDIDAYRRFLDAVENAALEEQEPVIEIRKSGLANFADTPEIGMRIIENLVLKTRDSWRAVPEGHNAKDIAPWKFRRRLSVLRRPLLQLDISEDPLILFAPGLLREGFVYMFMNYLNGSYQDVHLGPAMKRYVGHARKRDGLQFNNDVEKRMRDIGWQANSEVNITKILAKSLDKNYGDVDVLAWNTETGRVLIMECKDLQLRKTYGEIAEQLNDFRGQITEDGKRDLLRKHLDRVQVLREHLPQVRKYLGIKGECEIESHIVFSHPVPMLFADGPIREHVDLHIYSELETSIKTRTRFV